MLEKHLNADPKPGTRLQGCAFVEVKCDCGQSITRCLLDHHQSNCPQRPFSCEHCKSYNTTFLDVTTNHWPVCGCYPVSCPNNCTSKKLKRQDLQQHLSEECPLQEVECEFKHAGCETKVCRKNLCKHISSPEDMASHMCLLARQNQKLGEQNEQLARELRELKLQVEFIQVAPVCFLLTHFKERKEAGDRWCSEGFYTHPGGYKMFLSVVANGCDNGKSTHVSCYIHLLRGKFDSTLKWPFQGKVTIQLLNQRGNSGHLTNALPFDAKVPKAWNSLAMHEDRAAKAYGYSTFIHHSYLEHNPYTNCQYLVNNSLSFRIEVKVL